MAVEGEELQWVGLAPLAVDERYRGQGIGRQLVYEGLDSLNEFGYAAVRSHCNGIGQHKLSARSFL